MPFVARPRAQLFRWALCAVILAACLSGIAQPAQQAQFPPGVLDLGTGWRFQMGDNPACAQPAFDDSSWQVIDLASRVGHEKPGWRWYRKRVSLPPGQSPLSLFVFAPRNDYEVYIDGQRLPGSAILPRPYEYGNTGDAFPLPLTGGDFELAIRARFPRQDTAIYGLALAGVAVGGRSAIQTLRTAYHHQALIAVLTTTALNGALIIGGIGVILLYLLRRDSREYLWLGLYLIFGGATNLIYICGNWSAFPLSVNTGFGDPLGYPAIVYQIEFTYAFARRRVDRWMRGYEIVVLAMLIAVALENIGLIPPLTYILWEEIVNVPAAILLPVLLLIWFLRGNREAGWLILPSLFPSAGTIYNDIAFGKPVYLGSVPLSVADIADFIFLLAIGIVMALRFTRVSQEQARAAAELDAAREIQQRLVPIALPDLPGCRIEAAYLPANEVGGDFYQVLEQPDGSSLIVVGDVSGKGLRAAMTGARAIGALRAIAAQTSSPGALLEALNQQIYATSDGGFITCLCAALRPDGTMTLANAGHLAPYRNGFELPVDSGLPLGIVADAEYADSPFTLGPGDRLTFLSDGVVEASNAQRELFGFDRTASIASQSALDIARAAQAHGQQDDITVLTLAFAPVHVASA